MKGPFFPARQLLDGVPRIDSHGLHTLLTDGAGTFGEYIRRGRELGLEAVAFTEHASNHTGYDFEAYARSKVQLQEMAWPMRVYLAAEVKLAHTDGTLDLGPERIALVDFIVGVLHSYPDGKHGFQNPKKWKEAGVAAAEVMEQDYQLSRALIHNPAVDVWGHPAGVFAANFGPYDAAKLRELIGEAAAAGRVIELNSAPRYRAVFPVIVETCLELDCLVSIGSDAHHPDQLGHVVGHLEDYLKTRNA